MKRGGRHDRPANLLPDAGLADFRSAGSGPTPDPRNRIAPNARPATDLQGDLGVTPTQSRSENPPHRALLAEALLESLHVLAQHVRIVLVVDPDAHGIAGPQVLCHETERVGRVLAPGRHHLVVDCRL